MAIWTNLYRRPWTFLIASAALTVLAIFVGRLYSVAHAVRSGSGSEILPNPFLDHTEVDRGWPFVRGPACDGHSPEIGLADHWPDSGPPVLWARDLGHGYSSFVTSTNCVFTQYQSLAGQFVVCLSAETGETVWEYRYDWPYEPAGLYPGPRATPT